jgi:hypothetical protein
MQNHEKAGKNALINATLNITYSSSAHLERRAVSVKRPGSQHRREACSGSRLVVIEATSSTW